MQPYSSSKQIVHVSCGHEVQVLLTFYIMEDLQLTVVEVAGVLAAVAADIVAAAASKPRQEIEQVGSQVPAA